MATGAFDLALTTHESIGDGRFGAVLPTVVDNEIGEGEYATMN